MLGNYLGTITIGRQARYAIDDRLVVPADAIYMSAGCSRVFADEVTRVKGVRAASCASAVAVAQSHWGAAFSSPGGSTVSVETAMIDYGFFDLFDIKPVAGRLLTQDRGEDDALHAGDDIPANPSIVINESAVRALGFGSPQAAVGQSRPWTRPEFSSGNAKMSESIRSQIVGVVPDFSLGSVRTVIEPTVYYADPVLSSYVLLLRVDGRLIPETLRSIKELWVRQGGTQPFEGKFLSQYLDDLYLDVVRQSKMVSAFASVTVVIAALGLFGLAVFLAERQRREIGLRKVMGASRMDILRLLGWQFVRPVLWANLIAWPIAYFCMQRWLEGFAYHVDLNLWVFVGSGAFALVTALATVSGHALVVAHARPVDALRYE